MSPGDNATLYCDCKTYSGVYIVWYRNCSHVNQPTLVMKTRYPSELLLLTPEYENELHPFPHLHLVRNNSSESFDLLITNISDSDEGLYYCGTEKANMGNNAHTDRYIPLSYGNVTSRILMGTGEITGKYPGMSSLCVFCNRNPLITRKYAANTTSTGKIAALVSPGC